MPYSLFCWNPPVLQFYRYIYFALKWTNYYFYAYFGPGNDKYNVAKNR